MIVALFMLSWHSVVHSDQSPSGRGVDAHTMVNDAVRDLYCKRLDILKELVGLGVAVDARYDDSPAPFMPNYVIASLSRGKPGCRITIAHNKTIQLPARELAALQRFYQGQSARPGGKVTAKRMPGWELVYAPAPAAVDDFITSSRVKEWIDKVSSK